MSQHLSIALRRLMGCRPAQDLTLLAGDQPLHGSLFFSPNSPPLLPTGWMAKVKLSDTSELDDLMDKAAYEAFCAE